MKITRTLGVRRIKVEGGYLRLKTPFGSSDSSRNVRPRVGTGLACEAQLCWWRREKSCENKKQDSRDPGPGAIGGLASLAWAGKMCQQWLVAGDLGVATGAGLLFESRPAALAGEGSP